MMVIGITGSFGSGKTTVAKMFAGFGAYVIDADSIYHSLIKPGKICYKKIIRNFGKEILKKDNRIDRVKLGDIVFKQKSKLMLLNRLTHPEVIKEIRKIVRSEKRKVVIIEAPLLIESGFYKDLDRIILVVNKKNQQIKRASEAKGLNRKDVSGRIRMQMPLKKKLAFADFIIDNSGSKKGTLSQARKVWEQIGEQYGCKRKTGY